MPPKRSTKAPTAPVRRSTRIQSRDNSKEPSQEPSAAAICAPPPPPATAPETPQKKQKAEKKKTATKTDEPEMKKEGTVQHAAVTTTAVKSTEEIIRDLQACLELPDKRPAKLAVKKIVGLTPVQCEAVIFGLAKQNAGLRSENEELKDEVEDISADRDVWMERSKPNLRRQGFYKNLEKYGDSEAPAPASDQTPEENVYAGPVEGLGTEIIPAVSVMASAPLSTFETAPEPLMASAPAITPVVGMETTQLGPVVGMEIAQPSPVAPSPWRAIVSGLTGWVPGLRKRKADDDAATESPATKIRAVGQSENTPMHQPSLAKAKMRSVKNPEEPSSLFTVSEVTEPPSTGRSLPDPTPSKRKPSTSETPRRTSVAVRRAQLEQSRASNTPKRHLPFVWEKDMAKPKPKQPNADARLAKIQEVRDLRARLDVLMKDPDVKDIDAHSAYRRKKMNVDKMKEIPHNRPGDAEGCFRVPEIDSDDEMSVDMDLEECSNVFDEDEKLQETTEETTPKQSTQQASQQDTPKPPTQQQAPIFAFPTVATMPPTYHATEEFKQRAGAGFAAGLAAFIKA